MQFDAGVEVDDRASERIRVCLPPDPPECKVTQQGGEYIGRRSVTLSGHPCQPWASSTPHAQLELALHRWAFADADAVDEQHNFCRNPDGKVAPWCYNARGGFPAWEFCDIPFCNVQPSDRSQQPVKGETEKHAYPECRLSEKGKEYVGTRNETSTGKPCLRWDSQPHGMPWDFLWEASYEKHFLGPGPTPHENHCRNPGVHRRRPWCFVSDPHVQWEYCDIPFCDDEKPPECKLTGMGGEYVGKLNVTLSGSPCQRWLTPIPKVHEKWNRASRFSDELDGNHNFCRNVDEDLGPWCYTTAQQRWEYCDVPFCPIPKGERCLVRASGKCVDPQECKKTKNGVEYIGTLNMTTSGLPCQPWMSQQSNPLHQMGNPIVGRFPDEIHPTHNYCRNPDSRDGGPWCFNGNGQSPVEEFCDVPMC
ncbi:unnamed protein product [Darwinula stevensoni]|uniref:Kringle domain-containing protein n=1 Tax=Darwinula stevensoni TaxID=69355 RepID=A0A7R8X9A7_9CRUS|nr:unnamed protein product [Darwinula stevensoni]CAG0884311.1 unnamed protein product [Darwinula stevensoni]